MTKHWTHALSTDVNMNKEIKQAEDLNDSKERDSLLESLAYRGQIQSQSATEGSLSQAGNLTLRCF